MRLSESLTWIKRYGLVALLACYDMIAVMAAMALAVTFRYDLVPMEYVRLHDMSLPFILAAYLVAFYTFRLYRYQWQYAGVEMLWSVLLANLLATLSTVFWQYYLDGSVASGSIIAMTGILSTLLVGGQRVILRSIAWRLDRGQNGKEKTVWEDNPKRTIILGGGQSAVEVLAALGKECAGRYDVIGILDNDVRYHGCYLRGIKILGGLDLLHEMVSRHAVDEVIIAMPNGSDINLRDYALACCRNKVAVRMVPVIADLLENPTASQGRLRLQDVTVEDLLHRPPLQFPLQELGQYLVGKRVLVTGAGGSIGSELCRQISHFNPALLVLMGHGENSLHMIKRELSHTCPELEASTITVVCDVRDVERVKYMIAHFRPQIIFHAAAHKHVPMMEENAAEAVTNNVGGTRNVARAASANGVERMVLISSDKAVNPSSIMGASKFLCEEIVRAESAKTRTTFVTVRFGNVLGSRGSVLPVFQEQILHGGPVTVTHPDMNRYFMTIPEAVSLVLQAGALGHTGDLFVLDMGNPVRIIDLAENVIRLSGLEPHREIRIDFSGLRPGEKLSEELFTSSEMHTAVSQGRFFIVNRPQYLAADSLDEVIDDLLASARRNDDREVIEKIAEAVPTFRRYTEEVTARAA